MTRSIPFHKQIDPAKQAGQQTFDRMPFLKHSTAEPQQETTLAQRQELTLSDYIARKTPGPERITFDEWWNEVVYTGQKRKYEYGNVSTDTAKLIWNAALKQGKL